MKFFCSILVVCVLSLLHATTVAQTSTYENPVAGKEYTAEWETYEPETPKNDFDSRVSIENVVLLTSQKELAERISVESLASYVERLEADLLELATEYDDHGKVWLQVDLGREIPPAHQLSYDGSITTGLLQSYYESLSESGDSPAVSGPVSFQLVLVVRDHSGQSSEEALE